MKTISALITGLSILVTASAQAGEGDSIEQMRKDMTASIPLIGAFALQELRQDSRQAIPEVLTRRGPIPTWRAETESRSAASTL